MTRLSLALSLALAALALLGCASRADLVVRGGSLVDGTGGPARRADVAVSAGRIAAVGDLSRWRAARTLDASGLVVAPGFVDMHSHADLILLAPHARQEDLLQAKVSQGVATIIVGNCGLGVAPANEPAVRILAAVNGWMTPDGVLAGPLTVGEYLGRLETQGVVVNVGTLVPHGPVRISALGLAPGAPEPASLAAMRAAVERGLDEGAFGLSAGLIYPPGMYADTAELIELATEVAGRDRLFTCHVRGSSETLLDATRELLEVAEKSGARVHHSHLEAVGERFWPGVESVLALEDVARARGLRVSHDVFVYPRAATMMAAIFPPWALEGGVPALLDRLRRQETRDRIRGEISTRAPEWPPWQPGGWPHNLVEAVGWDGIRVASVRPGGDTAAVGRSIAELAADAGREPFDLVADLMLAEDGQVGQLVDEISGRDDRTDVLMAIATHPSAAVIADAEDYGRGSPHPAHAGAFARVLRLAREGRLYPLEEAIRRMTSYPASLLGLADRGTVREGAFADLVVFDPKTVADRATWDEPRLPAAGVRWVVINGELVVDDGVFKGGRAGRVLRAGARQAGPTAASR